MGKEFIKRLLQVSVEPELIKVIGDCIWDKKTRVLTTPEDIEDAGKKNLEDAAWYQKDYGVKNSNKTMESRIRTAVRSKARRRNCWRRKISTLW